jgi:hypothetical protein
MPLEPVRPIMQPHDAAGQPHDALAEIPLQFAAVRRILHQPQRPFQPPVPPSSERHPAKEVMGSATWWVIGHQLQSCQAASP